MAVAVGERPSRPRSIELYASRWGRVSGLAWIGLGIACVVGILLAVGSCLSARSAESRLLVVIGTVFVSPALGALAVRFVDAGRRLLRRRRASIELHDDRLVIHDRWMLRMPIEIFRGDITEIQRLARLSYWQYTGFASKPGRALGELGPLLDWQTIPNTVIHLAADRCFDEAIRTMPTKTPLQPISRNTVASALILRVVDPETAFAELSTWMATAYSRRGPQRSRPDLLSGCLVTVAGYLAGLTGFVLICVGLALGAQ